MRTPQGLVVKEKIPPPKSDEFWGDLMSRSDIIQKELRTPKCLTLEIGDEQRELRGTNKRNKRDQKNILARLF